MSQVCAVHDEMVARLDELRVDVRDMRDDLLDELRAMREASEKRAEGTLTFRRDLVALVRTGVERVTQPSVAVALAVALIVLVAAATGLSVTYRDLVIQAAGGAVAAPAVEPTEPAAEPDAPTSEPTTDEEPEPPTPEP